MDVPDAPWVKNYDRYFNEFYQVVEDTEDDYEYERETEDDRERISQPSCTEPV